MSGASLCTSPALLRTTQQTSSTKQNLPPSFSTFLKLNHPNNQLLSLTTPFPFCNPHFSKNDSYLIVKASETEAETSSAPGENKQDDKYEVYEVVLDKPYGLRFTKGRDGGTYIDVIAPGGSADKTGMFTVGDKVLATRYLFFCFFFFALLLCHLFSPRFFLPPLFWCSCT